ncbi:MAG TPA: hypothetical protein VGF92_21625 [Stellaceae bacterium]|jgi:hypothetical protein
MAPFEDWPRARTRRTLHVVPALLLLAILDGCAGSGSVLRQFGVVGTFAEDCSKGIAEGGARAIYDVPPAGVPTFTAVNRYGTFRSKIVRADRVSADTIIMYTDDPGGAWNEIDIRKAGNGFVTTRMISHKPDQYRPLVAIGDRGMGGAAAHGLYVEKCSDNAASAGRHAAPG